MQQHLQSTSYYDLVQYYTEKIIDVVSKKNKSAVFWQEAFANIYQNPTRPSSLPPSTITPLPFFFSMSDHLLTCPA